jgi:hypothetical protein
LAPANKAARVLHLTAAEFEAKLPELIARGFPTAEPVTGFYDLKKIDEWLDDPQPRLTRPQKLRDAAEVFQQRLAGFGSGKGGH